MTIAELIAEAKSTVITDEMIDALNQRLAQHDVEQEIPADFMSRRYTI